MYFSEINDSNGQEPIEKRVNFSEGTSLWLQGHQHLQKTAN